MISAWEKKRYKEALIASAKSGALLGLVAIVILSVIYWDLI